MPKCPAFHSKREVDKPAPKRVHHNNDTCPPGRDIKANGDDVSGTGNYRLCEDCDTRNSQGK
jgi:hypothetical protein